jgi:hypothetical protein
VDFFSDALVEEKSLSRAANAVYADTQAHIYDKKKKLGSSRAASGVYADTQEHVYDIEKLLRSS